MDDQIGRGFLPIADQKESEDGGEIHRHENIEEVVAQEDRVGLPGKHGHHGNEQGRPRPCRR